MACVLIVIRVMMMTEQVQIVERMPRKSTHNKKWTDEMIDWLRELAALGIGETVIARRFSERYAPLVFTRCAMIGARHRHNIPIAKYIPKTAKFKRGESDGRSIVTRIRQQVKRTQGIVQAAVAASASHVKLAEPPTPVDDLNIPLTQRCTLLELNDDKCHWPVGSGADLFFCGGKTAHRSKYCGHHACVATAGPQRWNGRRS